MAIDAAYRAAERGEDLGGAVRVVYVSPLKALAVDIHQNLERPLAEIAEVARELGLAVPPSRWRCAPATPRRGRGRPW